VKYQDFKDELSKAKDTNKDIQKIVLGPKGFAELRQDAIENDLETGHAGSENTMLLNDTLVESSRNCALMEVHYGYSKGV